jgi:hypothetical protein
MIETYSAFIEHEDLLPWLQKTVTGLQPEPVESTPHRHTLFLLTVRVVPFIQTKLMLQLDKNVRLVRPVAPQPHC